MKKIVALALCLPLCLAIGCSRGEDTPGGNSGNSGGNTAKKEIVVDGGGDIGNFNTTLSMIKSDANPFPYNTLRTLCDEWEALNPDYYVTISVNSMNGDRSSCKPLLTNKTAPDLLYQNGSVIYNDLGEDYYVELGEYLAQPNKYAPQYETWFDLYGDEIYSTQQSDGGYYYFCLERIPVGIIYNKSIFEAVFGKNYTLPKTYAQFMDCQEAINDYFNGESGKAVFLTTYQWYDIVLESSILSSYIDETDVIRKNGAVDTEELVRAINKGIFDPSGEAFEEYIKLIYEKNSYYPENWQTYDSYNNFVKGNLAMMEGTGETFRKLAANTAVNFEWDIMPYPDLTTETCSYSIKPTIRGCAGLASAWFVTKSAEQKGTVDGVIDLMMYLTAPQNNNRLIGDLNGGIPLNPDEDTVLADYLTGVYTYYMNDTVEYNEGKRTLWGSYNTWVLLGDNFRTSFIKATQDMTLGSVSVAATFENLAKQMKTTATAYYIEFSDVYDIENW